MLKLPTATFTIVDTRGDSNYKHISISLNYSLENKLDATSTLVKLSRFLRDRQIDCTYVSIDDIVNILFADAYGVNFDLPRTIPIYVFRNYRVKIITINEESMDSCRDHTTTVVYKIFMHILDEITLTPYGVSNMYPTSLTKDDITIHHDPTRVLGHIDKSAHTTPKKVICSGPVTTVIFEDGTKSQVRCSKDDEGYNDYEKAFMMAWLYQLAGKKNVRKVLKENQDIFGDSEETNSIVNALNNIRFMFNGRKG